MAIGFRIFKYFRKYALATGVAYVCLMVVTGIELSIPELIRRVIDCGIRTGGTTPASCPPMSDPMSLVQGAALLIVGLTVVKGGFQFGQGYLGEYGAQGIAYDIRNDIYRHLQKLSFSWHDRAQTGQLMARATSDVEQLRNFTGRAVLQLANLIFMATGITVVLFATNWKLAIAAVLTIPHGS